MQFRQPNAQVKQEILNAIDLIETLLVYDPNKRPQAMQILTHHFFDSLRDPNFATLPNGEDVPEMFNFTKEEIENMTPEV